MPDKPVVFISATRRSRRLGLQAIWSARCSTRWATSLSGRRLLPPLAASCWRCSARGSSPPRCWCSSLVRVMAPSRRAPRPNSAAFLTRNSRCIEAERLGKPVIYHFLDDVSPRRSRSRAARAGAAPGRLSRAADRGQPAAAHDRIATTTDLELSIHRISDELQKLRGQADRRHRRLLRLVAATAVGIVLIVGLILYSIHRLSESDARLDDKLLALREQVAAAARSQARRLAKISPSRSASRNRGQGQNPPGARGHGRGSSLSQDRGSINTPKPTKSFEDLEIEAGQPDRRSLPTPLDGR